MATFHTMKFVRKLDNKYQQSNYVKPNWHKRLFMKSTTKLSDHFEQSQYYFNDLLHSTKKYSKQMKNDPI